MSGSRHLDPFPPLLAALLYLPSLPVGFLSDDFLYLAWAGDGPAELFRRLTVDSYPQVIRPLPGLGWWLASVLGGAGGGLFLHLVSLLLHALSSLLVTVVAERVGAGRGAALAAGLLFAAFPLAPEAVSWASGSFDLWATALALGALAVVAGGSDEHASRRQIVAGAALFALALLAKESVLLLPVVALLACGRRRLRGTAALAGVSAVYLAARLDLFGGLGGYTDAAGGSLALSLSPLHLARTLLLQIPHRLLVPWKEPGELHPVLLGLSAVLLVGLALAARFHRRPADVVLAAGIFLLALLPAAPILGIEWHHEGSRLLYFPAAVGLVGLARASVAPRRGTAVAVALLLGFWGVATLANQESWREAGAIAREGLAAMTASAPGYPDGATVLVDLPESHLGAYVFRNGLPQAARLAGIGRERDQHWLRGTSALVGSDAGSHLGSDLFVLEPGPGGVPVDRTVCERALWSLAPQATLSARPLGGGGGSSFVGPLPERADGAVLVALPSGEGDPASPPVPATLHWRAVDGSPFNVSASRHLLLAPGGVGTPVRLPTSARPLLLRIDLSAAGGGTPVSVAPLELPAACRRGARSAQASRVR